MNSTNLKSWSDATHTNGGSSGAYVKDNSGAVRSIWDQLVMGIDVSGKVSSEGFCKKVENLSTVVKSDGTTCYQKIDETLKKTNRKKKKPFCNKIIFNWSFKNSIKLWHNRFVVNNWPSNKLRKK